MNKLVTFATVNQFPRPKNKRFMIDDSNNTIENPEEYLDQIEAQSSTPPPCRYTEEEVIQRVLQATADVDAGKGLMHHEEFKELVRSWYN